MQFYTHTYFQFYITLDQTNETDLVSLNLYIVNSTLQFINIDAILLSKYCKFTLRINEIILIENEFNYIINGYRTY